MSRKKIFDAAYLGDLCLKNRLIRSATWEALCDESGAVGDELCEMYCELARGGVGAIITSLTSVTDDDHCLEGILRLSKDELMESHKKLVDLVHEEGGIILTQIVLGEYHRNEEDRNLAIDDLTMEDLERVKTLFVNTAIRAEKAGYDGIQLHAAHGFFLSRFISPTYNHRSDCYGGSAEHRGRLLFEILKEIGKQCPKLHLCMKINSSDFREGGLTPEDSLIICKMCEEAGVHSIEVSGTGTCRTQIKAGINEAYFKEYAIDFAAELGIPVILVGGNRSIENMEAVLNEGNVEFLSLSRPLIREPNLPNRWFSGETEPAKCISCNKCYDTHGHVCIFNVK